MTKFISLPTGQQMPILGFGTWQVRLLIGNHKIDLIHLRY